MRGIFWRSHYKKVGKVTLSHLPLFSDSLNEVLSAHFEQTVLVTETGHEVLARQLFVIIFKLTPLQTNSHFSRNHFGIFCIHTAELKLDLEDSNLPFQVDIIQLEKISDDFLKLIEGDLLEVEI